MNFDTFFIFYHVLVVSGAILRVTQLPVVDPCAEFVIKNLNLKDFFWGPIPPNSQNVNRLNVQTLFPTTIVIRGYIRSVTHRHRGHYDPSLVTAPIWVRLYAEIVGLGCALTIEFEPWGFGSFY